MQWPNEKGQTIICKTLHRKLRIGLCKPCLKPMVNSGALEGVAVDRGSTPSKIAKISTLILGQEFVIFCD